MSTGSAENRIKWPSGWIVNGLSLTDSETRPMPSSTAEKSRKPSRLPIIIGALIILAGVIYTGGWYYLANQLESRVATNIAAFKQQGIDATCENARASGYPLRVGLDCSKVGWVDQAKNISITAGSFRSAAQVYDPLKIVSSVEGPAAVDVPGAPPLDVKWEHLATSVRLDKPLPKQLSIEGSNVMVNERGNVSNPVPLAVMQSGKLEFNTAQPQMDIALSFDKLKIADNIVLDRPLPELTGAADVQLANGFALLAKPEHDLSVLRGQTGTLRKVELSFEDGSGIAISGPFSVADDGRISGDFKVTMRNPEGVAKVMQGIFPEAGNTISTVVQAMAFVPKDASGAPTLPITVKNGKMSVGFIGIGRLPAL
ncbi:hypothetical protein FHS21_004725 [Phyllobacterium trifolii]|uniref:DUF2125 domain-containing protein n=1 Tax=Phyllobacterium trifolii TaxID=300193 RepID=A0A839UHM6_9HYPH|nr:DUF2125 domain-containing protein [Phyllobacterium trifolii]MBB3148282.1 hypothetical protein [Phyllobacterium trifolii]